MSPGLPIAMRTGPIKFTYAPGLISIYMQSVGHTRFIRMNQEQGKTSPKYYGNSVGHWEGDTLVAETTNISDRTLLDDLVPHTLDLKVTEHLRLVDADTLEDRITIEDPSYFKRPWDAVLTYKRQPPTLFPEDVCLDRHDAHQPAFASR